MWSRTKGILPEMVHCFPLRAAGNLRRGRQRSPDMASGTPDMPHLPQQDLIGGAMLELSLQQVYPHEVLLKAGVCHSRFATGWEMCALSARVQLGVLEDAETRDCQKFASSAKVAQ